MGILLFPNLAEFRDTAPLIDEALQTTVQITHN